MSTPNPPHDAQRELEQRALRNVRGLVEKMDSIENTDKRLQKRLFVTLIAAALVLVAAIVGAMLYMSKKYESPPVKVDPAKLPPIRPGPPK